MIALLPLWAMCDRWDIGGLSTNIHPDTGAPTVFIYDGHPGGVGITERGFDQFEGWVADTVRLLEGCPCERGCPSCVQSPKCGNLNEYLDKAGALDVAAQNVEIARSPFVVESNPISKEGITMQYMLLVYDDPRRLAGR